MKCEKLQDNNLDMNHLGQWSRVLCWSIVICGGSCGYRKEFLTSSSCHNVRSPIGGWNTIQPLWTRHQDYVERSIFIVMMSCFLRVYYQWYQMLQNRTSRVNAASQQLRGRDKYMMKIYDKGTTYTPKWSTCRLRIEYHIFWRIRTSSIQFSSNIFFRSKLFVYELDSYRVYMYSSYKTLSCI